MRARMHHAGVRWLRGGLGLLARVTLWLALALPALGAQAVIQPGEPAPAFTLNDAQKKPWTFDEQTTGSLMLVFFKPGDRYTSQTLSMLDHLFTQQPALKAGLHRLLIVSRLSRNPVDEPLNAFAAGQKGWKLLLDADDKLYCDYRIIATPTVVLVGPDRTVAAVHPGFDPGMEQALRLALAKLLGVTLEAGVLAPVPPPDMRVQMGRRLMQRGLWDRALQYFRQAAEAGPLPDDAKLDLARIHLELNEVDPAVRILDTLTTNSALTAGVEELRAKAQAIREGRAPAHHPSTLIPRTIPTVPPQAPMK